MTNLLGFLTRGQHGNAADGQDTGAGGLLSPPQSLEDLLTSPSLGLAAGLLQAADPRSHMSLGQGLAQGLQLAGGLQEQRLANDAARARMLEAGRRRGALEQLRGLLGTEGGLQGVDEQQLLGLLADVAPEQVATGLLTQFFPPAKTQRTPTVVAELEAAGIERGSPEFRDAIMNHIRNSGGSDETLRQVQLELAQNRLQQERSERERKEDTADKQRIGLQQTIRRNLAEVQELATLNHELQGTFLEAGLPGTALRRTTAGALNAALSIAGVDRREQAAQIAKFDRFNKGLNDLIIRNLDRFSGRFTNQQLTLLTNASANVNISPQAISSILSIIAQANLDNADKEGIDIADRSQLEEFIKRERSYLPVQTGAEGGTEAAAAPEAAKPAALPARVSLSTIRNRPELDVQIAQDGHHFLVNTQTGEERVLTPRELRALGLIRGER